MLFDSAFRNSAFTPRRSPSQHHADEERRRRMNGNSKRKEP
jgi:hypothetical protein